MPGTDAAAPPNGLFWAVVDAVLNSNQFKFPTPPPVPAASNDTRITCEPAVSATLGAMIVVHVVHEPVLGRSIGPVLSTPSTSKCSCAPVPKFATRIDSP